jgi:DNA (cytosine-5)-methyltransferase 1
MFRLIQELRPSFVIGENVSGHIKLGLDTVLENLESEGYTARTFSISAASIGANHKRERVWTLAYSNDKGIRARFGRSNYDYEKKGRGWSFDRGRSESDDEWSDSSTTKTEALDVADSPGKGGREPGYFDKEKRNTESSATQSQSCSSDVADTNEYGSHSQKRNETKQRGDWKKNRLLIRDDKNVADTNSKRRRLWETGSEDAEDVGQSSRGQETLGWWDVEPDVGRVGHGIPQRVDRLKGLGNAVVPQIPFLIGLTIREMIENE